MSELTLIIGYKNYSSWSFRAWIALRQSGLPFQEHRIAYASPEGGAELSQLSPTVKVPVLIHGALTIWESLAICEYAAELAPQARLWPEDRAARAYARSVSTEMHAGFEMLRDSMPMNCRAQKPGIGRKPDVEQDIQRITAIWNRCRTSYGGSGSFLFGDFTIADAMFAPVVSRFITYGVGLEGAASEYAAAMAALPAFREWMAAAAAETEWLAEYEAVE